MHIILYVHKKDWEQFQETNIEQISFIFTSLKLIVPKNLDVVRLCCNLFSDTHAWKHEKKGKISASYTLSKAQLNSDKSHDCISNNVSFTQVSSIFSVCWLSNKLTCLTVLTSYNAGNCSYTRLKEMHMALSLLSIRAQCDTESDIDTSILLRPHSFKLGTASNGGQFNGHIWYFLWSKNVCPKHTTNTFT